MFVTEQMIQDMVARYGAPTIASFHTPVSEQEYRRIRASQKDGRNHDVTLYVHKDDKIVVIAKPFYPSGLFRAPSGGLKPDESFEEGIAREMQEEAGIEITLRRFLLRTSVIFENKENKNRIDWRSFVFLADYRSGNFQFTDHSEIASVRLASWGEFQTFSRIMLSSDIGGLHYRAALHEQVAKLVHIQPPAETKE